MKIDSDSPQVRIPPPLALLVCLALAFVLDLLLPLPWIAGVWRWVLGGAFFLAGAALVVNCIKLFKKHRTNLAPWSPSKTIIHEGPYRFSRNPIYLGFTVVVFSISFLGNTLWALAMTAVFFSFVHFYVVAREERYLMAKFGAEYATLKNATRRWL